MTFTDWHNNENIEVIVSIKGPWNIAYLRRELDKIANHWKVEANKL
jgi:predicted nuclease of restriction endonuclease-like RecB superfamily